MAYASKLNEAKFNALYDALNEMQRRSAESQYHAKLKKAKTAKQRRECAGHYPSEWSELFNLWLRDKVTNLYVYDCLKIGYVIGAYTDT